MGIEPALQNEHGGDLVDDVFSIAQTASDGVEMTMGFGGAHALIPQMHRQIELRAQTVGKYFRRERPRTAIAGQMNRPSNDNFRTCVAPQQAAQGAQIIARIRMQDGEQGLCRQTKLIRNGHANATLTMVNPKNSRQKPRRNLRRRGRFHVCDGTRNRHLRHR